MKKVKQTVLSKLVGIEKLPQNVRDSIPLTGFMPNGVVETYPGTFARIYKLPDTNFTIAPEDEQYSIYLAMQGLLNSFDENAQWEFSIFNHSTDKQQTLRSIRIDPQKDSLNRFRGEINKIMLASMQTGNASISQDKYLTVSIDDNSADHAISVLNKIDIEICKQMKKITSVAIKALSTLEAMNLLYNIYNQEMDYRLTTGIYNGEEEFELKHLAKLGLSVKDVIGPLCFDFTKSDSIMLGDSYAQVLYLERVPSTLSTDFLSDLVDIQSKMLTSVTYKKIKSSDALTLIKNQFASIEASVSKVNRSHMESGYIGALPPELEAAQRGAREIMEDVTTRNQSLFLATITVVVFAESLDKLSENVRLVKSVANTHRCPLKALKCQQEFAFNTALPLCRNDLYVNNLFTTEGASIFIPFNTQELNQKNALFYGLNESSKGMVLYDRTSGNNYNGLIFGGSGSGKSFFAKFEMALVMLKYTDAQVFVIDPQGEYSAFAKAFNGQEIKLAPKSSYCLNPLDINLDDIGEDEGIESLVANKTDYILSLVTIMNKKQELLPAQQSLLDKCVQKIYRPHIESLQRKGASSDQTQCPTLTDLYQELKLLGRENMDARYLADIIEQYTVGSFNSFATRTNVETNARFIAYNTKSLGVGMKELGLYICLNDVLNRTIQNSKKHIYTWFYIDELHILLESAHAAKFLSRIWKTVRKWRGVPTGILHTAENILRDDDTRDIFKTSELIVMLKMDAADRQIFGQLLNLSDSQLSCLISPERGHGLLYNGKFTIPFGLDVPNDTELYSIITTAHDGNYAKA